MGDLNYRLQCPPTLNTDLVKAYADSFQLHKLLPLDQLHAQQKNGLAFTQFHEGRIDFKPTYKYDPSTNTWDSSEKNRVPAWCDRILYYSNEDLLEVDNYQSYPEMIISDHKPVSCLFNTKVRERRRRERGDKEEEGRERGGNYGRNKIGDRGGERRGRFKRGRKLHIHV